MLTNPFDLIRFLDNPKKCPEPLLPTSELRGGRIRTRDEFAQKKCLRIEIAGPGECQPAMLQEMINLLPMEVFRKERKQINL
mgnify:CR=1 FL=1